MGYIDSKGKRVTSETAYLTPDVLARPNLRVATGAFVRRILFEESERGARTSGVEFSDVHGKIYFARASKEVVLS